MQYLELVQLQLVGIFTNTENILEVDGRLDVLHTQLLEAGQLETEGQFVYIHNEKNILHMTYEAMQRKKDQSVSLLGIYEVTGRNDWTDQSMTSGTSAGVLDLVRVKELH